MAARLVDQNSHPNFHRLWTKLDRHTRGIVVCNAVFKLLITRDITETFAIRLQVASQVWNCGTILVFLGCKIFSQEGPLNFWGSFVNSSQTKHMAKFGNNVHIMGLRQDSGCPLCQEDEDTASFHCTVQCPNAFAKEHSQRLHSLAGFFEKYPLVSPLEVCQSF